MSGTIVISEEKFSTDELGRHVTTLTEVYRSSVNSTFAEVIEKVISECDEQGQVEYWENGGNTCEVYGKCVCQILSELAESGKQPITVVGGIDEKQLYEIQMLF